MTAFKIEKFIQRPPPYARRQNRKYPLQDMAVDDSFSVGGLKADAQLIRAAAGYHAKKTGKQFSVLLVDGDYRCWRVK